MVKNKQKIFGYVNISLLKEYDNMMYDVRWCGQDSTVQYDKSTSTWYFIAGRERERWRARALSLIRICSRIYYYVNHWCSSQVIKAIPKAFVVSRLYALRSSTTPLTVTSLKFLKLTRVLCFSYYIFYELLTTKTNST